jgi:hypothetical protein
MKDISDAAVTLYNGNSVAGQWKISDCQSTVRSGGNWWHVFTIDGKTNKLKWNCQQGPQESMMLLRRKGRKGRLARNKSWDIKHMSNRTASAGSIKLKVNAGNAKSAAKEIRNATRVASMKMKTAEAKMPAKENNKASEHSKASWDIAHSAASANPKKTMSNIKASKENNTVPEKLGARVSAEAVVGDSIAKRRAEFYRMKTSELKRRARALGANDDQLDRADDRMDVKGAVIDILMRQHHVVGNLRSTLKAHA